MAVKETAVVPPQPSVIVDRRVGEFLLYRITTLGSTPAFTLVDDRGRTILTSQGIPPQMVYEREWPKSPDDDPVPPINEHSVIGLMAAVKTYTYEVELIRKDGSLKEKVIHSIYERIPPLDDADQFRRVLGVKVKFKKQP
jgi:hypothetical protein